MALKDIPAKLRPYIFHGVQLDYTGSREPVGNCPFCNRENKFYVSHSTGLFKCHAGSCGMTGNIYDFLRDIHSQSVDQCESDWLDKIAASRGITVESLQSWGITQSSITGEVVVPTHNAEGKLNNLYQWLEDRKSSKRVLYPTPTLRHGLFGVGNWDPEKPYVVIAEGPWTGLACVETLGSCRGKLCGKVQSTRNKDLSILSECNVVGVPGCGSFRDVWTGLFANKIVFVAFDNDHPDAKGKLAGWQGTVRTATILLGSETPPESVHGLQWGADGYDPELPNHYDLRDPLKESNGQVSKRLRVAYDSLVSINEKFVPIEKPTNEGTGRVSRSGNREPAPEYCELYREVRNAWRKALRWTDNLDITLSSMLATAGSTGLGGMCPLWLRVIGTPGTAKSTLCEALAVSRKYTYSVSTLTGLHSGAKDSDGNTCSLIPDMDNKVLITKDGDTLINASNRDQLLSQLRDIYEGTSRARYRNSKTSQEYTGLRITYILAGTKSLRRMNRSYLGDRFLDVVIYNKGDDEALEQDILRRSARNALRKLRNDDDSSEPVADIRHLEAKELTAGYLHYLRENMEHLVNEVGFTDQRLAECKEMGELVSYMRARPDKELEDEDEETELATRLTEQMVRLAGCTAVVLNTQEVDDEVMRRVKKVAADTSRGITFGIAKALTQHPKGLEARTIAHFLHKSPQAINSACRFLQEIRVLKRSKRTRSNVWILSKEVRGLMELVLRE